ncbi:putative ribosomal protein S7e [Helianthus annuus]|nr:putative ribosomal protein S7e [Helianthus annuus]
MELYQMSDAMAKLEARINRFKIQKDKDVEPTEFEQSVAQALFDLENTHQELKSDLKDLYINSANQIDVSGNRKAVVVHVPYRLRKPFRKIHTKLVRELEKKFSGKDVVFIATRRIVRPPKKGSAVQRPRSRTLTSVHDAMLEDVVHPAEIVGKRVRYRLDGSKIIKVYLDPKARNDTEYKLETFSGVYRKLSVKKKKKKTKKIWDWLKLAWPHTISLSSIGEPTPNIHPESGPRFDGGGVPDRGNLSPQPLPEDAPFTLKQ